MQKRCFHSSTISLGRKTGASAFVAPSRPLSKKQTKRKRILVKARAASDDQQQKKTKSTFMKNQMASMDMAQFVKDTAAEFKGVFQDLLLPDGTARLDVGESDQRFTEGTYLDPMLVLFSLRDNKAKQDFLLGDGGTNSHALPSAKISDTAGVRTIDSGSAIQESRSSALGHILDRDIRDAVNPENVKVQKAAMLFARRGKFSELGELVSLTTDLQIKLESNVWPVIIAECSKRGRNKLAEDYFDMMLESGVEPTLFTWSALIQAIARGRGPDAALEQVDILKRTGVEPSMYMLTSILNEFVAQNRHDDCNSLWIRMHWEDCELTTGAFAVMMKLCTKTGTPERAFFYMDEMRCLGIEPNIQCFLALFRSCAEAPHWVDGYHDIVFDAMAMMEGAEIKPNVHIYNAIIYAFSRGGDTVAAEFYFWEMKRKGLVPDTITYNTLLNAFSKSQTVGAESYGKSGRFAKNFEPLTAEEQDYADLGANKVAKMMAQNLTQDFDVERGSRQKTQLETLQADEDPEVQQAFRDEIRREARDVRTIRAEQARNESLLEGGADLFQQEGDDFNFNELSEDDPELKKLMKELEGDQIKSFERRERAEMKRLSQGGMLDEEDELEVEEREGDGYDDGEAQYEAWLRRYRMTKEDTLEKILDGDDSDVDQFDDTDRDFLGIAEEKKAVTGKDGTRERVNSSELDELVRELGLDRESTGEEVARLQEEARARRRRTRGTVDPVAAGMMTAAETLDQYERNDREADMKRVGTYDREVSHFQDRLASDANRRESSSAESIEQEGRRMSLTSLLDSDGTLYGDEYDKKTRIPGTNISVGESYVEKKRGSYVQNSFKPTKLFSDFTPDDIAHEWDMVEFGRAPNPDYSMSVAERRIENCKRAEIVFQDMKAANVPINIVTINTLMGVYANAVDRMDPEGCREKAMQVFDSIPSHELTPSVTTYRCLIKMHILAKDIQAALELKEAMIKDGIIPDSESYGWLIRSCGHRDMLVEGLKLLEETTTRNIPVYERHLQHLRARCKTLGIVHPDMPVDPIAWVAEVKKTRRDGKFRSKRKVGPILSKLYGR